MVACLVAVGWRRVLISPAGTGLSLAAPHSDSADLRVIVILMLGKLSVGFVAGGMHHSIFRPWHTACTNRARNTLARIRSRSVQGEDCDGYVYLMW